MDCSDIDLIHAYSIVQADVDYIMSKRKYSNSDISGTLYVAYFSFVSFIYLYFGFISPDLKTSLFSLYSQNMSKVFELSPTDILKLLHHYEYVVVKAKGDKIFEADWAKACIGFLECNIFGPDNINEALLDNVFSSVCDIFLSVHDLIDLITLHNR